MTDSPGVAVCRNDRKRAFANAVEDITDHTARVDNTGVEVFVQADEHSHAATMNDLGKAVRAYGMQFGTGIVTEGETLLRFVERQTSQEGES